MDTQTINIIKQIGGYVWGVPLIALLVGTGLWLTLCLHGLQFRKLGHALYLGLIKRKESGDEPGDISHFQALMTALSATVGTGNIAGVATAIVAGGPGALFWMWITGLVGMATKYAEAVLAVKYRVQDKSGTMSGGPMYYISQGLGWKWLGATFALFAAVAAFGIGGMVQSNSIAEAVKENFHISINVSSLLLMAATALVIIGGIKSIGRVTSVLVPIMIVFYVGAALLILLLKWDRIPAAFQLIFQHAFSPTAATGGFLGATVMKTIRMGVARGIFSNESGLGSAPIAAAAACTRHPVTQALVSMTQTFIDTILVCTMTGLVLLVTDSWHCGENGVKLTSLAFKSVLPGAGGIVVGIGLVLFAYSTILGWSYYGEKSICYLLGEKAAFPYRFIFVVFVGIGAVTNLQIVWNLADIFNGLMAFPNLIGLLLLSPVIISETRSYFAIKSE